VMVAVFVGAEIGIWLGGLFGGFVAVLLAIPTAAVIQIVVREIWQNSGVEPTASTLPASPQGSSS